MYITTLMMDHTALGILRNGRPRSWAESADEYVPGMLLEIKPKPMMTAQKLPNEPKGDKALVMRAPAETS